jgi:hypothetical protein
MEMSINFSFHKWHLLDGKLSYIHNNEQQFRQCNGMSDIGSPNEKSSIQQFQTSGM